MTTGVVAGAAVGAAIVAFLLVTGLRIGSTSRRAARAWDAVDAALVRRRQIATALSAEVRGFTGAGEADSDLRRQAAAPAPSSVAQRQAMERALSASVSQLREMALQFPELAGAPEYRRLGAALAEAQASLRAEVERYGAAGAELNRRLQRRLLRPAARLLRYRPAPAFDPGDPVAVRVEGTRPEPGGRGRAGPLGRLG